MKRYKLDANIGCEKRIRPYNVSRQTLTDCILETKRVKPRYRIHELFQEKTLFTVSEGAHNKLREKCACVCV